MLRTLADAQVFSELVPPGYNILHVAQPEERGVLFKEGLSLKTVNHKESQFELMERSVKTGKTK